MGVYPCIPLTLSWVSNNAGTESKRAVSIAWTVIMGHCFSILGTHIYPESQRPSYPLGFGLCFASMTTAAITSLALHFMLMRENSRKEVLEAQPEYEGGKGDRARGFRFVV